MKSLKNTNGSYAYFGVGEGLKTIVTDTYTENSIRLLFNIDVYHYIITQINNFGLS